MSSGWKNKNGTGVRTCKCGSWKNHWLNFSDNEWPSQCSVVGCKETPILGAHVINPDVKGEKIVPMCGRCNQLDEEFSLRDNVARVSANTANTCN